MGSPPPQRVVGTMTLAMHNREKSGSRGHLTAMCPAGCPPCQQYTTDRQHPKDANKATNDRSPIKPHIKQSASVPPGKSISTPISQPSTCLFHDRLLSESWCTRPIRHVQQQFDLAAHTTWNASPPNCFQYHCLQFISRILTLQLNLNNCSKYQTFVNRGGKKA